MKLLMITGLGSARDLASGKKGAFYNTLEEFHKHCDRIDIICPRANNKFSIFNFQFSNNTRILFGNVYIHISPWPLVFHPLWFLKKGLEIYKEQKFDLMTVQEFPPFYNGIGARLLWQKTKVPYVLEIHHIPGYPKAANFKETFYAKKFLWRLYWRFFGSKAKAIRVVNQNQTSEFLKKAGVPADKMVYMPSAYVDFNVFKPMNFTKEYDLIFVGRLEENKGVYLLLEAVRILKSKSEIRNPKQIQNSKSQTQNIKILIVGEGPLKKSLKFKVESLKLENNVIFHGYAKDAREVAELLNRSKVLVMPSYNEGGPRVVLEAMACGVPVLATNVGLMPDLADENAVKIVDWNAKDIANKAKELLENAEERERLSQAGLEIAGQFEKKAMIKNYADKLKEFI